MKEVSEHNGSRLSRSSRQPFACNVSVDSGRTCALDKAAELAGLAADK